MTELRVSNVTINRPCAAAGNPIKDLVEFGIWWVGRKQYRNCSRWHLVVPQRKPSAIIAQRAFIIVWRHTRAFLSVQFYTKVQF